MFLCPQNLRASFLWGRAVSYQGEGRKGTAYFWLAWRGVALRSWGLSLLVQAGGLSSYVCIRAVEVRRSRRRSEHRGGALFSKAKHHDVLRFR